jgi:hypothetical protein
VVQNLSRWTQSPLGGLSVHETTCHKGRGLWSAGIRLWTCFFLFSKVFIITLYSLSCRLSSRAQFWNQIQTFGASESIRHIQEVTFSSRK